MSEQLKFKFGGREDSTTNDPRLEKIRRYKESIYKNLNADEEQKRMVISEFIKDKAIDLPEIQKYLKDLYRKNVGINFRASFANENLLNGVFFPANERDRVELLDREIDRQEARDPYLPKP